nr:glycoside hydrolase family 3 N-terminal domain-containing protein [uncultured Blautia sp.]
MNKKRSHIFRGLASIFLAFTVLFGTVMSVALSWEGRVNELLGVADDTFARSQDPDDYYYKSDYEDPADLIKAEIALNTRMEAEGAVALKGTPAVDGNGVTLFGMRSQAMQYGGSMGSLVETKQAVSLADALEESGFSVNPDMVSFYKDMEKTYAPTKAAGGNCTDTNKGTTVNEVPVKEYFAISPESMDGYKDAAVVVLGRDAGEGACFYPGEDGIADPDEFSNSATGNILSLSNAERALINYVENQGFKKVIVLLNSACAMEIEELKQDDAVDSILWIGNPGCYGTYGIAELLKGDVLPSGHLTDTYAVNSALAPAMRDYGAYVFTNADDIDPSSNNALRSRWYLAEEESIYIGYKYYETRYFDSILDQGNASQALTGETVDGGKVWDYDNEVSYSFGYGVEGSTFSEEITDAKIDWSGETQSEVTVKVTNTGDNAAKHAVQLYVSLPYTDYDRETGLEKSAIQLVGYGKTGESKENSFEDVVLLEPGESEDVTITFTATDLYSYDTNEKHDDVTGAYILEAGDYYFATGNGAHDAVQSVLKEQYPDKMKDAEPTGTVYKEAVDSKQTLTESNGTTIQNQLTDGDLNSYNCGTEITYLSRNDWAHTFPEGIGDITATEEMIALLRNEIYDKEAENAAYEGETEFTYGADNGVQAIALRGLDYDDPLYDKVLDEVSLQDMLNTYCALMNSNEDIVMPKENCADSPLGLLGTIGKYTVGTIYEVAEDDPSYGHSTAVYVSENVVAATFSRKLASEQGRLIGNDGLWDGYTAWYAPGLNIHRNQYNARNLEYYSEDSILTGTMGADVYKAARTYGLVPTAKHFAFNDQETNRDGMAVFIGEQASRENELRGFQIAFRDGNATSLMTAFNRLGCTHVGASKGLMNGILRGEWGFKGYVITDSVKSSQYFLPSECLVAGNDRMLGGSNNVSVWGYTEDEVKDDPVIQAGVRESYHRYLYTYVNSSVMNGISEKTDATGAIAWWILALQLAMGICFTAFIVFLVLFILKYRKERKNNESEKIQ